MIGSWIARNVPGEAFQGDLEVHANLSESCQMQKRSIGEKVYPRLFSVNYVEVISGVLDKQPLDCTVSHLP